VLELAADEFRRQMDVNVIESIIATQAFGPLLGSEPSLKGKAGADRDDQLGGRQSADVGLFSLEARDRNRIFNQPS
jgi:NAD(P)-dependent dehydrogenase (short-subunit alcohol dehydrogenase family)